MTKKLPSIIMSGKFIDGKLIFDDQLIINGDFYVSVTFLYPIPKTILETEQLSNAQFQVSELSQDSMHEKVEKFWMQLIDTAYTKLPLIRGIKLGKCTRLRSFLDINTGIPGTHYVFCFLQNRSYISLYIDKGDKDWNKKAFYYFEDQRSIIEGVVGHPLVWKLNLDKRASRIDYHVCDLGYENLESYPQIQTEMISAMVMFEKSFQPFYTAFAAHMK